MSLCLSLSLYLSLLSLSLSIYLPTCISTHLSTYLSAYLSVCLSICLSTYLFIYNYMEVSLSLSSLSSFSCVFMRFVATCTITNEIITSQLCETSCNRPVAAARAHISGVGEGAPFLERGSLPWSKSSSRVEAEVEAAQDDDCPGCRRVCCVDVLSASFGSFPAVAVGGAIAWLKPLLRFRLWCGNFVGIFCGRP